MLEERGQAGQEKEGKGVEAHLFERGGKRRRQEKCVRERGAGPAFMLVPEGRDSLCAWRHFAASSCLMPQAGQE